MLSTNLNRSSKLKERRGRDARRRLLRSLRLETLEDRRLMDAGGNTLATATDLGPLQGSRVVSDYVGPADRDDYFRFNVSGQAPVDVRLDQLSADADLTLLNASGGMIRSSAYGGNSPEAISITLPPGTYYVRVYPYGSHRRHQLPVDAVQHPRDARPAGLRRELDVSGPGLGHAQRHADLLGLRRPNGCGRLVPLPRGYGKRVPPADGRDDRGCGCASVGLRRPSDRRFLQRGRKPGICGRDHRGWRLLPAGLPVGHHKFLRNPLSRLSRTCYNFSIFGVP